MVVISGEQLGAMMNRILATILIGFLCACDSGPDKKDEQLNFTEIQINNATTPNLFNDEHGGLLSYQRTINLESELVVTRIDALGALHEQVVARGNDWFVNWADFPAISRNGNHIVTWYLKKHDEGTYSYNIWLVQSFDNGQTWQAPLQLNNDESGGEHGFADIIPFKDGFLVSWLDGRNTVGHHGTHTGAMMVNWAIINSDGSVQSNETLDTRACDCCHTALAMVAGSPIIAYRDRSAEEVRDMAISRWENTEFGRPARWHNDQWQINGCPVNGPSVLDSQGQVALAWFTRATGSPELKFKVSNSAAISLSNTTLGRIDTVQRGHFSYVSHLSNASEAEPSVEIIRVDATSPSATRTYRVTKSSIMRSSGIPRMAIINDQLWVAVTNDKGIALYYSDEILR
jgi:hypothetical protein